MECKEKIRHYNAVIETVRESVKIFKIVDNQITENIETGTKMN